MKKISKRKILVVFSVVLVIALLAVLFAGFLKSSRNHSDPSEPVISVPGNELIAAPKDELPVESQEIIADSPENGFEICFLDVGQGDSALVSCDSHYMLIDGGTSECSRLLYSVLKSREISYLDYVVCTHPHEDHCGGLAGALNYAAAGTGLCSFDDYDLKSFHSFQKYLSQGGGSLAVPSPGDTYFLGSASFEILGPLALDESDNINNDSLIVKITYGDVSFLLMGDAEEEEELSLLNAGADVSCNVLKVGHHGSSTSSTGEFLKAASPEAAVISVGADNTYGHPHDETLERLNETGAMVYRTDECGDITFWSDGKSITVSTEK